MRSLLLGGAQDPSLTWLLDSGACPLASFLKHMAGLGERARPSKWSPRQLQAVTNFPGAMPPCYPSPAADPPAAAAQGTADT